jgi:hypothetical protein
VAEKGTADSVLFPENDRFQEKARCLEWHSNGIAKKILNVPFSSLNSYVPFLFPRRLLVG